MELNNEKKISEIIEYPVLEVITRRRSVRAFAERSVDHQLIQTLFEAARWAPSSVNEQPWRYVYATRDQPELYERIFGALNEKNKVWAKDAPLLIASFVKRNFSFAERSNTYAKYDLGGANAFLSLQATDVGLQVHQLAGYDSAALRSNLNVPEEYELGVVMAIGYPGDPEMLPEYLMERELAPRKRNQQSEFVMNSTF